MAENDENLSPEEKLLKVIQGDGEPGAAASAGEETVATPSPSKASKLKLASRDESSGSREDSPTIAAAPTPPADADAREAIESGGDMPPTAEAPAPDRGRAERAVVPSVLPLKRVRRRTDSMLLLNRCLVVVVLLVAGLVVYEVWASSVPPKDAAPASVPVLSRESSGAKLPSREQMKRAFAERDVFRMPPVDELPDQGPKPKEPVLDYAKKNLKMIGHSPLSDGALEAIVSDRLTEKLHFLKSGQAMVISPDQKRPAETEEITARTIEETRVLFAYKDKEFEVN